MSGLPGSFPLLAFTVACGESARAEARQCEASFRHWHPEIPFLCIDDEGYRLLSGGHPPAWMSEIVSLRSLAGWFLSRRVRRLLYLDADIFVLGRLDALLAADAASSTLWTRDYEVFTMGVPECPRINNGVLASSDPAFWPTWTAAQYGCLLPAVREFAFDQLSLRLLVQAGAVRGRMIDGQPGLPYYNVSINEQPGEWRVDLDTDGGAVYKGAERALIYHQAGQQRGIDAAPEALRAHLREITAAEKPGLAVDFPALWQADGPAFAEAVRSAFSTWPTITLEAILAEPYSRTPGQFRTVAPVAWDRHRKMEGIPWRRTWNRDWHAYLYYL